MVVDYLCASVDLALQKIAESSPNGLIYYDSRHGWRKPIATIDVGPDWDKKLVKFKTEVPAGGS